MPEPIVSCAGTGIDSLPGRTVNNLLINVPQNASNDTQLKETRKLLDYAQPKLLCLDSGGYQFLVAEQKGIKIMSDPEKPINYQGMLNISPSHVVDAATKVKPFMMMSLDLPIKEEGKGFPEGAKEYDFQLKLPTNMRWARETSQLHQKYCPGIKLFTPVQAYNMRQLKIYLDGLYGVRSDGLSLPVRNLSVTELADFLIEFHKRGITMVHLLGTMSFPSIALSAYASQHFFSFVSIDATSWRIGAQNQIFLKPDLATLYIGSDVAIDERVINYCLCPWCNGNKTYTDIRNLPYGHKFVFLGCHNFWVTEDLSRQFYHHAKSLPQLIRFVREKGRRRTDINELIKALSKLDLYINTTTGR